MKRLECLNRLLNCLRTADKRHVAFECPLFEDTVEKVAAWLFQFARKKIDLSDRLADRSRVPVKGKRTPEEVTTEMDSDFFNSI
ncbi:hypothetical protein [Paraburkholderia sp. GAS334]|uniref:hypothetical protein n=1 Tax=Paraburkholderia sp. GAS334 TaxID=3035131 RepID=UPI003D1DB389